MKLIVSPPVRVVPSGQLTVARVVAGVPLPAAGSNATLSCEVKSVVLYWAHARSWSKPTPAIPPVSVIGWVNWTISTVPGSEPNRSLLSGGPFQLSLWIAVKSFSRIVPLTGQFVFAAWAPAGRTKKEAIAPALASRRVGWKRFSMVGPRSVGGPGWSRGSNVRSLARACQAGSDRARRDIPR